VADAIRLVYQAETDLQLSKSVSPSTAVPGDTITYILAFSNNGADTATCVVITDVVPVTVTVGSVISSGVAITDTTVAPPTYTWQVADLAQSQGGSITITGQVTSTLTSGGRFTNTATITSTTLETDTANNAAEAGLTIVMPPAITLGGSSGTESDDSHQEFTWTVTDTLGLSAVSVAVTQDGGSPPIFSDTNADGSFDFNAFGPGIFEMTVSATSTLSYSSTASRSVTVTDDDTASPLTVLGGSSGTEIEPDHQEFTWSVSDASGLSAVSAELTQDSGSGPMLIDTSSAASGTFDLDVYGLGVFTMTVSATDDDNDWIGDALNAVDSRDVTVIGVPDLVIDKTVTPAGPVIPGQAITYTLAFTNDGAYTATGVVITDVVPVTVTVGSVISSGDVAITDTTVAPPTYTWQVADLAQSQGGSITITGQVTSTLINGGRFTNTATITTTTGDTDPLNNDAAVEAEILPCAANLSPVASFVVNPNPAAPGQSITFDASTSSDPNPDDPIVQYEWDFDGNSNVDTSTVTPSVQHVYNTFGTYQASLTVVDSCAATNTITVEVQVNQGNTAPVADADGPYVGIIDQPIVLDGSASFDPDAAFGDSIVSYEWDVDGDSIFDLNTPNSTLVYTYTTAYSGTVGLRVTDGFGLQDTDETTVQVQPNVPGPTVLISPEGVISDTTPTYTWEAVTGATWYQLLLEETTTGGTQTYWREAATACSGVCTYDQPIPLNDGEHTWWVMTHNDAGDGPWSAGLVFWVEGPNGPPTLSWTGETNYVSDGLHPESGGTSHNYVYRIRYTDPDGDPPNYVRVHIRKGGTDIADSPFTTSCAGGDYTAGVICSYTKAGLEAGSDHSYYFVAQDNRGNPATPTPELDAPDVGSGVPNVHGDFDGSGLRMACGTFVA
jgi:uncharacterized repeat protein (TIGR01451 family)